MLEMWHLEVLFNQNLMLYALLNFIYIRGNSPDGCIFRNKNLMF